MRLLFVTLLLCFAQCRDAGSATTQQEAPVAAGLDPDGINNLYMGRQIARVMGHEGADWLERPGRDREEGTDLLIKELKLRPTDVVADIGAGTGYFSFRIAPLVPHGRVLAVDIQPEMLAILAKRRKELKLDNVEPVRGAETSTNLPANTVTVVLLVDAYHEFAYPKEMMTSIYKALRPGGRVALVEFRAEDPTVAIKPVHKMSVAQAKKEMAAVGLTFRENRNVLPQQHLMIFEKSAE
jgi:FkbM family methyltransferase